MKPNERGYCFWCGHRLKPMESKGNYWRTVGTSCKNEAHSPEEYIAIRHGRKPAKRRQQRENQESSSIQVAAKAAA